jgi:hypothetical protein
MDLEKLYENIVLRDLFEYLTPGSVFLVGLCLFLQAVFRRFDVKLSVLDTMDGSIFGLVLTFVLAYSAGHLLTGVHSLFFRKGEHKRTAEVLKNNKWLENQVEYLTNHYFQNAELGTAKDSHSLKGDSLREMVRALVYHRMPLLNREYVVRHSILSRFCENMALALTTLLIFISLSALISWNEVLMKAQQAPVAAASVMIFLLALTILCIMIFLKRAHRLRNMMIKHTFQIWYVDYVESVLKKKHGPTANLSQDL